MAELEGKVALVTGGGRGLGEAICRVLARAGAVVVAADVRDDLTEGVVRAIRQANGRGMAMRLDVTDEAGAERAIGQIGSELGPIDILVNNAGVDLTVPVDELSVADWDRILAVNLRGPFLMSKLALGSCARESEGTSSTSSRRPPSAPGPTPRPITPASGGCSGSATRCTSRPGHTTSRSRPSSRAACERHFCSTAFPTSTRPFFKTPPTSPRPFGLSLRSPRRRSFPKFLCCPCVRRRGPEI